MDFTSNKCPVCHKPFTKDDDVVVCPECGAPHHRDCYEQTDTCYFHERHAAGFDYADSAEGKDKVKPPVICPFCGRTLSPDSNFCKYCGHQLNTQNKEPRPGNVNQPKSEKREQEGANTPFGLPEEYFDPMGGVDTGFDMGDGVTAGEMSKYVKQNTPYFMRVFRSIRESSRSKFNFSAAIFRGGYLLYRKMYKVGAIITLIQFAMMCLSVAIQLSPQYQTLYQSIINNDSGSYYEMLTNTTTLLTHASPLELFMLYFPTVYSFIDIGLMITIGFCANRMYFKHCKKQITAIKAESPDRMEAETKLQTKGGVNIALAISLLISYLILDFLPTIISMF